MHVSCNRKLPSKRVIGCDARRRSADRLRGTLEERLDHFVGRDSGLVEGKLSRHHRIGDLRALDRRAGIFRFSAPGSRSSILNRLARQRRRGNHGNSHGEPSDGRESGATVSSRCLHAGSPYSTVNMNWVSYWHTRSAPSGVMLVVRISRRYAPAAGGVKSILQYVQ